jgi:hypothetical protein
LNPKFASERTGNLCELRVRGTSVPIPKFVTVAELSYELRNR